MTGQGCLASSKAHVGVEGFLEFGTGRASRVPHIVWPAHIPRGFVSEVPLQDSRVSKHRQFRRICLAQELSLPLICGAAREGWHGATCAPQRRLPSSLPANQPIQLCITACHCCGFKLHLFVDARVPIGQLSSRCISGLYYSPTARMCLEASSDIEFVNICILLSPRRYITSMKLPGLELSDEHQQHRLTFPSSKPHNQHQRNGEPPGRPYVHHVPISAAESPRRPSVALNTALLLSSRSTCPNRKKWLTL